MSALLEGVPAICEKNVLVEPVFTVADQYGTVSVPEDTEWTLTDSDGTVTGVKTPFSIPNAGHYTLTARSASAGKEADASIFVTPPMPVISAGCDAMASSAENVGTMAAGATDGDDNVRWGSQFRDDQRMVVDLGNVYELDRVRIFWNTSAYATDYTVAISMTGYDDDFEEVEHKTGYVCSSEPEVIRCNGRSARYVRLTGHKRSTDYGTSVDELEVYGLRMVSVSADTVILPAGEERWFAIAGIPSPRRPLPEYMSAGAER